MIVIEIGGYGTTSLDFTEGLTVDQAMTNLKTQEKVRFIGAYSLQETKTGRVLPSNEVLLDGRIYYLTAQLERVI